MYFSRSVGLAPEVLQDALDLLFLREDTWRQQAAQAERIAFGVGERRALVQERIVQKRHALGGRR